MLIFLKDTISWLTLFRHYPHTHTRVFFFSPYKAAGFVQRNAPQLSPRLSFGATLGATA